MGLVRHAGLLEEQVLCDTQPPPEAQDEMAVVCTDDTIFIHTDSEQALKRLDAFDSAFDLFGVPRNRDKDVTLASSIKGLGCELSAQPPRVDPDITKLWPLVCASTALASGVHASPLGVHDALGVAQWLCLMSRPHYAVFSEVY